MFTDTDIIFVYTRAEALKDGVLVDAGHLARDAGFRWPVAMTAGVHADCVAWSEADTERTGQHQDESGRLWDVLAMAALAARTNRESDEVRFTVARVSRNATADAEPEPVNLIMHVGPGDTPSPVITIMFPGER